MGDMVTIEVRFTHEELVIVALAAHHAEMTLNDFIVKAAVVAAKTSEQEDGNTK